MKSIHLLLMTTFLLCSCASGSDKEQKTEPKPAESPSLVKELNTNSPDSDQYVKMETSMGDVTIKLYRETPGHRKNFINLVMNGFYDGQLFYRVKKELLIQTGDYTSKTKPDAADLGVTDVEFTVPSEIDASKRYHKRGAVAAASFNKGDYSSGAAEAGLEDKAGLGAGCLASGSTPPCPSPAKEPSFWPSVFAVQATHPAVAPDRPP